MILLLAAALLLQDKTAEESLKQIEETLADAKSIMVLTRCNAKFRTEGKEEVLGVDGSLSLKEGNKSFSLTSRRVPNGGTEWTRTVSDGKKLCSASGSPTSLPEPREKDVPANHNELRVKRFVRVGLGAASLVLCQDLEESAYAVSDVKFGASPEGTGSWSSSSRPVPPSRR